MQNITGQANTNHYAKNQQDNMASSILLCNWQVLRKQLLQQWTLLTPSELAGTGPNCRMIASLISRKYGIEPVVVENYLRNFERTIPLL